MEWIPRWARRFARLAGHAQVELEMDEEMRHHLECEIAERVGRGMTPEEARRTALIDFGGVERFKEESRDARTGRGGRLLDDLLQDLRIGSRTLRRCPGFSGAAILTFALGMGAATAIFSVIYGVLLRPLPYRDPARLVTLWERDTTRSGDKNVVAVPNFEAWSERARSFSGMAALVPQSVTVAGDRRDEPEHVAGAQVTPGYFALLGVAPVLGREFTTAEGATGGSDVVILSHGFWQRRFGGDSAILGRTMTVGGRAQTIVGVMPAGFVAPSFYWLGDQEVWFPFGATTANRSWGRFLLVVARLRPGATIEQARAELAGIARQRAAEDPTDRGWSTTVAGLKEQIAGNVRTSFLVVMAAVGLLLVMAMANVAALTLVFTGRRGHEFAVRRAIGASRPRLLRQLLTQSAVLGVAGGMAGLVTAAAGVRALVLLLPADTPRLSSIHIDLPVLAFTLGGTLLATLLFGSAGVRGTAGEVDSLHRGAPGRVTRGKGAGALVVAEIAFGLVLSVFAVLMVRTWVALHAVDLGFSASNAVSARVTLPGGERYATPDRQLAFFDGLLTQLRAVPAIQAASLINARPFSGPGPATSVVDPTQPVPDVPPVADVRVIDPAFFQTLKVRVLAGGVFDSRLAAGATAVPPVVIVNRALARTFWASAEGAVGRHIGLDMYGGITPQIVGVVGDIHLMDARTSPRPTAYLSASQFPLGQADVLVRGSGNPQDLLTAIRNTVRALDPGLPVYAVSTLGQVVDRSMARDRFTTLLLAGFAMVAVLLGAVGVYGVFAGEVARRRREIGIRMALGAKPSRVVRLIVAEGLVRAVAGIALGAAVALILARPMAPIVFGVNPADPLSFLVVAALLLAVAIAATALPAIAAGRIPPLEVMRSD